MRILHSPSKVNGAVVVDGKHVFDTIQCGHCGSHEEIVPGSGKKRGFCPKCKKFVCGKPQCMQTCIPFEASLDYYEAKNFKNEKVVKKLISKYPEIGRIGL